MQYLELRYNSRLVRLLASFSYIISIILYMGVVLYAPCLALHTITGLPVVGLILLGGIVSTIYTVMVSYFHSFSSTRVTRKNSHVTHLNYTFHELRSEQSETREIERIM